MSPEAQAQIDADPKLAKAMVSIKEVLLNAHQGVKDGRYKSLDDAVEAMTGQRPTEVTPPHPPQHGYFASIAPDPKGDGWMCVISDGHPKRGHSPVALLDLDRFRTREDAQAWFERRCVELPWEDQTLTDPVEKL